MRFIIELYPVAWLLWRLGWGSKPAGRQAISFGETLRINQNERWMVTAAARLSACDNRPGLGKLYLRVLDEKDVGLGGVVVRFGWAGDVGMAYDHPNIWGLTDDRGYLEWAHFGVPTRYCFYMESDPIPLIEDISTILGNEYCQSGTVSPWAPGGWRPVNRPGVYSYRFVVQRKESE